MNHPLSAVLLCGCLALCGLAMPACAETVLAETNATLPSAPGNSPPVQAPAESGLVTLENAVQRAVAHSPLLKASMAALGASQGERRQAGMWVNPEASVDAENVGGQGPYRGLSSAEVTYGVSQLIEIGGKRSARFKVADQGVTLAGFDQEAARLDLIRDVHLAYIDAIAAQEQITLMREQKELAEEVMKTVNQRVNAAREPLIQKSKAQVTLSSSAIALDKAERQLIAAKKKLAAYWGNPSESYGLDSAALFNLSAPPPLATTDASWKNNPDFARFDAEINKSRAALELEQANAIPDPRISAGFRDFRDSGDHAFVVGVSLPIPVWNRNQGNIDKARHELARTESNKEAVALTISAELTRAQAELETAYHQAAALKDTILPAAKKAFALSREGYGIGKLSYLEVLDAERTLYETRAQYQDALRDYHKQRAEMERLTAAASAMPPNSEKTDVK